LHPALSRLQVPPRDFIMRKSTTLYDDTEYNFKSTTLMGIEYDLIVFQILLYVPLSSLLQHHTP
jgi:hypothetical protein